MKYKRILLKLSGEALMGDLQYGIDPKRLAEYADEIKQIHDTGVEIAIVIGGGNIFSAHPAGQRQAGIQSADLATSVHVHRHQLAVTTGRPDDIAHQRRAECVIRRRAQRSIPAHFRRHAALNRLQRRGLGRVVTAGEPVGHRGAAAQQGGRHSQGRHTAHSGDVHQDSPPSASSLIWR